MEGHEFGVNALAFLPGDRQAVSASVDETVRLWDLSSGRELAGLRGHDGPVLAVAVSPGGRWAASGGIAGAIPLWLIYERRDVESLSAPCAPCTTATSRLGRVVGVRYTIRLEADALNNIKIM